MSKNTIHPEQNLKKLTDDELSRLFHICKENVDLFEKLLPGHPWIEMLKKNPSMALQSLVYFTTQQK